MEPLTLGGQTFGYHLGRKRPGFGGTDALSMSVQPAVLAWLAAARPPYVLAEGDRLGNAKFFAAVLELGYEVRVIRLTVSQVLAAHRRATRASELGVTAQSDAWLKGRITKVANLVAGLGDLVAEVDADGRPEYVLTEVLRLQDPVVTVLRSQA